MPFPVNVDKSAICCFYANLSGTLLCCEDWNIKHHSNATEGIFHDITWSLVLILCRADLRKCPSQ